MQFHAAKIFMSRPTDTSLSDMLSAAGLSTPSSLRFAVEPSRTNPCTNTISSFLIRTLHAPFPQANGYLSEATAAELSGTGFAAASREQAALRGVREAQAAAARQDAGRAEATAEEMLEVERASRELGSLLLTVVGLEEAALQLQEQLTAEEREAAR